MTETAPRVAYLAGNGVYLGITNRCPTSCVYCFKRGGGWSYQGVPLRLRAEPEAEEAAEAALAELDRTGRRELVFCGLGEPTERLAVLLQVCEAVRKARPGVRLRLNTVGLGSLIAGRDITYELAAALDEVSVSLNTDDPEQWARLQRPLPAYRRHGFGAVCSFIQGCASRGLRTTATAIDYPGVNLVSVEILARTLGARFRVRPVV